MASYSLGGQLINYLFYEKKKMNKKRRKIKKNLPKK